LTTFERAMMAGLLLWGDYGDGGRPNWSTEPTVQLSMGHCVPGLDFARNGSGQECC